MMINEEPTYVYSGGQWVLETCQWHSAISKDGKAILYKIGLPEVGQGWFYKTIGDKRDWKDVLAVANFDYLLDPASSEFVGDLFAGGGRDGKWYGWEYVVIRAAQ